MSTQDPAEFAHCVPRSASPPQLPAMVTAICGYTFLARYPAAEAGKPRCPVCTARAEARLAN